MYRRFIIYLHIPPDTSEVEMKNRILKLTASVLRNLNFFPMNIRFIRHPLYRQFHFKYAKHFSKYYNFPILINVNVNSSIKFKMFCIGDKGAIEMELILSGLYEPEITSPFIPEIEKSEVFIDVGANIGYYSLLAAKIMNNNNKVIMSFEPVHETYRRLKKNISVNNVSNIKSYNVALGNANQSKVIQLKKELGHNSIIKTQNESTNRKYVNFRVYSFTCKNLY